MSLKLSRGPADSLKIFLQAKTQEANIIQELLSPWNVTFADAHEADLSVVYGQIPIDVDASVVIPSKYSSFYVWAKQHKLTPQKRENKLVSVPATEQTALTMTCMNWYRFNWGTREETDECTNLELEENKAVLRIDLVEEYKGILNQTLHPKQSRFHHLVTSLPIPYGVAPKKLRNLAMKSNHGPENLALCQKLPIDTLRFALVNAIEKASGKELEKKPIFQNNYLCILTHDVESSQGLRRARMLKKIEEKYDVRSAWYVPSSHYQIDDEAIRELANHGEVGAHDTRHDGKLAHLPKQKLVKRLTAAKKSLERIILQPVNGFRAPVLQHNQTILSALREAGYTYDTSIPTWEPKHPYTMKPHGIGTLYPLNIEGITEIPLTLPQDHQLLNVLGLSPEETLKTWAIMASVIRELGGVCMFLVHPDYELANGNAALYEEVVNAVATDSKATITVPSRTVALINE